ncbi:EAL domain-containing protein [Alkalicoccus chagannorensis]|uniref:EAL domain-containing protein n=1 Tax=Alkalicoccus chagannorensis TaxID=427072 RepID=UPI0004205A79|nr:EAL domain-containing protein [Alkalicoccus chagannorensis]
MDHSPPAQKEEVSISDMQSRVLHVSSLAIIVIGLLQLSVHLANELSLEADPMSQLVLPLYLIVTGVYLFRRYIPYAVQAWVNIGAVAGTGTLSLLYYGMVGPGIIFVIAASFLAAVLVSRRQAGIFMGACFLITALIGYLWTAELLSYSFSLQVYAFSMDTYISRIVSVVFFGLLILLNQRMIVDFLTKAVRRLTETTEVLENQEEELKAQNEALHDQRREAVRSEAKYRTIIENTEDFIFTMSESGRILSANKALQQAVNMNERQLQDQLVSEVLVVPEVDDTWQNVLQEVKGVTGSASLLIDVSLPDGAYETLHLSLRRVEGSNEEDHLIVGRASDVSDILVKEQQIWDLAYKDQLTGLSNRRHFEKTVTRFIEEDSDGTMLFLDLDDFKKVNDMMGHHAGDEVLRVMTDRISAVLGTHASLARLGGDEFAVFIRRTRNTDAVREIAGKLIEEIRRPVTVEDMPFYLGASIGISLYPEHGEDYDTLTKLADTAMYRAKEKGKNQYFFYREGIQLLQRETILMEAALREAVLHEDITIYFHPLVQSSDEKIIGAEVLMRWNSAELGSIPPDTFIPLMEQTGLIGPFTKQLLDSVFELLQSLEVEGMSKLTVNISPLQLQDPDFIQQIEQQLMKTGVPASCLELELTETMLIEHVEDVIEHVHALRQLGVRVALDDFGTGFSSLSHLQRMPIDTIKIDKSFIADILHGPHQLHFIQSLIFMSHHLSASVTAEGVENEEQAAILRQSGCDILQGYWMYPPMSEQAFLSMYQKELKED